MRRIKPTDWIGNCFHISALSGLCTHLTGSLSFVRMAGVLASVLWCLGSCGVSPGGQAGSSPGGWAVGVGQPMGLAGWCGLETESSRWWAGLLSKSYIKCSYPDLRSCTACVRMWVNVLPFNACRAHYPVCSSAGLRGEANAFEFLFICLPPAILQQTVHVQKGHLWGPTGSSPVLTSETYISGVCVEYLCRGPSFLPRWRCNRGIACVVSHRWPV